MSIVAVIQYSLAAVVSFLLGYQVMLSFLAFRGKKIHNFATSQNRKFAIVLPAYKDEKSISRSLYSLSGLVYPKNLYDLIVIVDNYSDKSAAIADKLGAIVLECPHEQQGGKNNVLRWAFNQILQWDEGYNAIIVFDSDSLVSGNYLEVMNYYLENGSKVIQSSDLVLPEPDVWSTEVSRIRFLLYNYVKPLGRKVLGLGMGLRCNGLCFSAEVLRRTPWQNWSLNNDVEYGLVLQLEGIDIDYAPEAEIWTQIRDRAPSSVSTRSVGRYSIIRKYAPRLLAAFIKKRSLKYLDITIDLITPPLINTLIFILLMCVVNAFLWSMGWASPVFFWIWMGAGGLGLIHLLAGLTAAGADRQLFKSITYIPRYFFRRLKRKSFSNKSSREQQVQNISEDSESFVVDDHQVQ